MSARVRRVELVGGPADGRVIALDVNREVHPFVEEQAIEVEYATEVSQTAPAPRMGIYRRRIWSVGGPSNPYRDPYRYEYHWDGWTPA